MRGHRSAVAAAFCTDDQVAFAGAEAAEFYFPLASKEDFRRSRVPQPCAFVKEHAAGKKIAKIRLTPGWLGLFFYPADAGDSSNQEIVLRTFGTANWTQFCPGNDTRQAVDRGSGRRD